jgi:transposase-like protein
LIELAQDFDVRPIQIEQWRDQLLEGAAGVFGAAPKSEAEPVIDVKTLHAKIGGLALGPMLSRACPAPQGPRSMPRYLARSARPICC